MDSMTRLKNIGINIKSERLRQGLSQEELAEKCDISRNSVSLIETGKINKILLFPYFNISRNSVSLIETGKINPTILRVIDIARVLGVDINTLVKDA